ncbi:adenylate/guanylate cyclase domain-containing protein [Nocardioides marmoribigeumensis]|uniref:Class 3 adenylate cyclase n=1 Tax=Nocardioides marmoribigeumensis TaxID=433649 RepID=A0ABU2BX50_9ACTN|nr:adenylate/guanylate cyclase domain-containing protein [Nocardioides marmoribigeumensis]MDR7362975.1 class 3 adenylate cyclase [Nocardioides marmoribigeumensis]
MNRCTACGVETPAGARFCPECGTPTTPPGCASCGSALTPGAKFCAECGTPVAGATPVVPRVEGNGPVAARRVTSVLFGDLVGFTALSESRDQEEVRELLSRYFDECRTIVGHYDGMVEKFIGDAVMAVWGVPTAYEDDAERAVRAGLEMTARVAALGADLGVEGLSMRVGVVTGEVAVTVGATGQGMVAGDPVNTAARVQAVAGPGQVWVDETTRLLTSSSITYVDAGSHALKGKAEPVPLWSVRAVVAARGGSQRADGLEAPLTGRDRELRLLKEHFHATLESGRPQLALVSAEPGVGKSRLGWEFFKYVDGLSTTVTWNEGRCLAYGEGVAYSALADMVRARLRQPLGDDEADPSSERLLADGLTAYVPDAEEQAWLRPRLATLLGVPGGDSFAREDLFTAWTGFFERVAADSAGLVLVLDDAQYADDGLVLFLEHLLSTASFPCFVLALARPALLEAHPGLATNRRVTVLHLDTLSDRDMTLLVEGLVAGIPAGVRDGLVARADGVPLFAVETVRSLIDRDLVVPRGGQYVLAGDEVDLDAIGAPASLQALVGARLDTLSPEQRRVVEMGSVLGATFRREELQVLCPGVDLDQVLPALVRTQILDLEASRLSAEHGQYGFVQDVVRQVAYGSLSRRDRKAAHLAVVALLESETESTAELAPILAQHYLDAAEAVAGDEDAAELTHQAVTHLRRAASRARDLGASGESVAHMRRAREHAVPGREAAEVEAELATSLTRAGVIGEAVEHATRAVAAFEDLGDVVAAGLAVGTLAQALNNQPNPVATLEVAEPHWERLLEREDADEALLEIAPPLLFARRALGLDYREIAETQVRISSATGGRDLSVGLQSLSAYYMGRDLPAVATPLAARAVEVARTEGRPDNLSRGLMQQVILEMTEDLPSASGISAEMASVARQTGFRTYQVVAEVNSLSIGFHLGEWSEPIGHARHVEMCEQFPFFAPMMSAFRGLRSRAVRGLFEAPWEGTTTDFDEDETMAWVRLCEAFTAADRADPERSVDLAIEACRLMSVIGFGDDFPTVFQGACELVLEAGLPTGHSDLLALGGGPRVAVPRALRGHRARLRGAWQARYGDDQVEAELRLREAMEHYEAWGSPVHLARTRADLALTLARQGRAEEAEEARSLARATYEQLGAAAWLLQLEQQDVRQARAGG